MAVVKGEVGEPARTTSRKCQHTVVTHNLLKCSGVPTTSVLAPPSDFLALLFFGYVFLWINSSTAPVPTKAAIPALRAEFCDIHRET